MQENHREITRESYLKTGEFFMNHDVRVLFKSERVAILVYLRSRSFRVSRDPTRTNLISGFMMDCIEAVSWFRFLSRLKFSTFFRWFRLFLIRFSCFSWRDLNEIVQNTKPVSFRIEKNLKILSTSGQPRSFPVILGSKPSSSSSDVKHFRVIGVKGHWTERIISI